MARYINADNLLEKWNNLSERGRIEFDQIIMSASTADVQEVVHAKWEDYYTRSGYSHTVCSACGMQPEKAHRVIKLHIDPTDKNDYILTNYCANCGAKMDKED